MANSSKSKGDSAERDAVEMLRALVPDLVADGARRALGAGRAEDTGDLLEVLPATVIQVKNWPANVTGAVRESALGARRQCLNAQVERPHVGWHVGLVKYPRARAGSVRWIACATDWPVSLSPDEYPVVGSPAKALDLVRQESAGIPRARRVVVVRRAGLDDIWVAPVEAWVGAYRRASNRTTLAELFGRVDR